MTTKVVWVRTHNHCTQQ